MARKRTKKWFVPTLAAAATSALLLAGCSTGPADTSADGPVTLEFWGWATGLESAVEAWNAENPDIQVDFFRMTGDDGAKVPPAIDAGTAPDVVQMSIHSLAGHIVNNRLTDITDYVGDLGDEFTESSWGGVSFDGAVYAVPQDSGPTGLLYRSDIFEKYGVAVPTTWAEYLDAARALKAADPNVYIAQFSPNETGLWLEQVWQNGGTWNTIDGDAWTVEVDNQQSQEVAAIWQTLLDEDLVKVIDMWTPEYWAEINAGTIASINYAAWFPALLEENAGGLSGLWSVAPTPTFPDSDAAGETGGSVDVVPAGTENVEQAVEFITWLNSSPESLEILIGEGGLFPTAITGLESDVLLTEEEYFGGQVINEVFADAAQKVPNTWVDGPNYDLTQDALKDAFAQVANGNSTFAEALASVQTQTVGILTDMGLNVR
ncbi:sugar ABC transporter substrate-binding protein [Agromyces atrinae]|uniref:ABC transporter substrate-binding protein n=1 Tax=Agromyces atrinae TaxID=592376 RepID=UPI001F5A048D|nr:sugar ABC transporter substrate-binding protein [Agromyces atrinae]MCI2957618.1 sugar ABC transporter substrate-binding protein [Agromyces atrinae]